MTTVITNKKGKDTLVYAQTFEYEAYEQVKKLCNSDAYVDSTIRIMPDAHAGKGCTVGTTMTISNKLTPNLVGVDIGCGMLCVKIDSANLDLSKIDDVIKTYVPHGQGIHDSTKAKFDLSKLKCFNNIDKKRSALSIGTLGGGNHLIEIGSCDTNTYLIIHTGSRKLGTDVCRYYQDLAFKKLSSACNDKQALISKLKKEGREKDIDSELKSMVKTLVDKDLAYLTGSDFYDYLHDMKITQEYAILNRRTIADIIIKNAGLREISSFETIHNYIDFDRMILRKGAVSAEKGEILLIPINMRDGSLLCVGKGNADWNYSAPHGAGRLMSRSKAKEQLNMEEFEASMQGIYTTSVCAGTLDEAPGAYKTMDEIMSAIVDTVDVLEVLKPIYNFKSH